MWKPNLMHASLSNIVTRPPIAGVMHAGKALRCPPNRVTNTKREMYDPEAYRDMDADDQDEYITIDPEVPLWDPSLTGGLQRNVSTTFGDAIFSDEVEPEAQQWWLNPPPGGWPTEKKRLLKAKTAPLDYNFIEDQMFHKEWLGEGRTPLSSIKPGDIMKGRVVKTLLREGVQIDLGSEWDGLLPIYQARSKAAYPPPPNFSALMDLHWIIENWKGLKEQPKLWNQRFRVRKKTGQQRGASSSSGGGGSSNQQPQYTTRHLRVYPPTEGFIRAAKEQYKARRDELQREIQEYVNAYIPVDLIAQFRVMKSLLEAWDTYREQWDTLTTYEEKDALIKMLVGDGILPASIYEQQKEEGGGDLDPTTTANLSPQLDQDMQQALALFRADLRQELEMAAANGDPHVNVEDVDRLVEEIISEMGLDIDDGKVERERDEKEKRIAESYNNFVGPGSSSSSSSLKENFPNIFTISTQKLVAARVSEITASKEFQDYLDWYQFYFIGDPDEHVALRGIWKNIGDRIKLEEEIEVKVHAVDTTGLHRFPIQLAVVDEELAGMIVAPEEWKPKLNLTNIPTPRWDEMEEYAASIGRELYVEREKMKVEVPGFYEEWNEGKRWGWMNVGVKGEGAGKEAEVVYVDKLKASVDMEMAEKIVRTLGRSCNSSF